MPAMSEYIASLENFPDLEVSIIRSTKINKVLKAILKIESIPKEDEFHFKDRSSKLLAKWNQILDGTSETPVVATNGHNGSATTEAPESKASAQETNGETADAKTEESEKVTESKDTTAATEQTDDKSAEKEPEEAPTSTEVDSVTKDDAEGPVATAPDAPAEAATEVSRLSQLQSQ
jgi:hypothetical protein